MTGSIDILTRIKLIQILQEIISVEDIEIKNCAIESLIDMLEDETKGEYDPANRRRGK